jgi:predicted transcriptional regulator
MPYRSLFHRSLDLLTCVYNHETEMDTICKQLGLGEKHVEELIDKLTEWELLIAYTPELTVSERGKNVLSFYHNYSEALKVKPLIRANIPDY